MQTYFDQAKKVIPSNLTSYFNTFIGVFNVLGALKDRFVPDYNEVQEAKNFQINDPSQYSCIYQDDAKLENQKRESFLLRRDGFKAVKVFLEKIKFDKIINTDSIGQQFYNQHLQCCFINLDELFTADNRFFQPSLNGIEKVQFLNNVMDEISLLLLEYFKGLYYSKQIQQEYLVSFEEIQNFIYKQVRNRAKSCQTSAYESLKKPLIKYYKEQMQNDAELLTLCFQISTQGLQLQDVKQLIKEFQQTKLVKFNDMTRLEYQFELSNIMKITYLQKLNDYYQRGIMDSFKTYINIDNEIYYLKLKERVELIFVQYLTCQQFIGGIMDPQINKTLQYLIYSIDWIQTSDVTDQAMDLINYLSQNNQHVFQSDSQILFQNQPFSVEILNNFKHHNKKKCDDAQIWWYQNISEEQNVLIICQIFFILARLLFLNNKLYIGPYEPANRVTLTQILRVLNNGKYHYLNQTILKLCENITFQLQIQLFDSIEKQAREQLQASPLQINLTGQLINLELIYENKNPAQAAQCFYDENKLMFQILKPVSFNGIVDQTLINQQNQFIQPKLQKIKQQYAKLLESKPPEMKFEVLSQSQDNSNVITLAISGFLSGDQDKLSYWKGLLQQGSGTVVALHWNCSQPTDFIKLFATKVLPQLVSKFNPFTMAIGVLDAYITNPYNEAQAEAKKVGKYLGYLIGEHKLFGDCQINIVVHSLGSVILLECIKILDKLYSKTKRQQINQIMIMGGAADVYKLRKRRWNTVAGRIYNIYSRKDLVLAIILRAASVFDGPCGLRKVFLGYKQVINCDFTDVVDGHFDYKDQLIRILIQSDFNNDFKYLAQLKF